MRWGEGTQEAPICLPTLAGYESKVGGSDEGDQNLRALEF